MSRLFDDKARDDIAEALAHIVCEAGRLILERAAAGTASRSKPDGSPSTDIDMAAEELILERLQALSPGLPAVAEETASAARPGPAFFLVDPLDGTRDFLKGTGEYTVNIALIEGGRPAAAAVAAPGFGRVWRAGARTEAAAMELRAAGANAAWREVRTRAAPQAGLTALVSRSHGDAETEACLARLRVRTRREIGSSLKLCLVASGEADIYVRCGTTMEWDIAAGDHIVTRAGGAVLDPQARPLTYGHHERAFRNGPFAAVGDPGVSRVFPSPNEAVAKKGRK